MGFFRRTKQATGEGILRGMEEAAVRQLPFQLEMLALLRGDTLEWEHAGQVVRGTATGEHRGATWGIDAGRARFVIFPGDLELWEYPTAVVATARSLSTGRRLTDVVVELLVAEASNGVEEEASTLSAGSGAAQPLTGNGSADRQTIGNGRVEIPPKNEQNTALEALSTATRELIASGPSSLPALRPVLVTAAEQREGLEERAERLPVHLHYPSDVIAQAFEVAVSALSHDLVWDDGDTSFEEWLELGCADGYRMGRRLLGTDLSPYPYDESSWDVPDAVIHTLSTLFASLRPFDVIDAVGRGLSEAVNAVAAGLVRFEDASWFPGTSATSRLNLYRATVAGGLTLALSEFEVLRDWKPVAAEEELTVSTDSGEVEQHGAQHSENQDVGSATSPRPMPWHESAQPVGAILDIGHEVLEAVRKAVQIDDQWSVLENRSLTWWSHRLAQSLSADPPRLALGDPTVGLRARTDVVIDVKADEASVSAVLQTVNRHASLGALVFDPDRRTVFASTTSYLHEGNRSLERVFSLAVILSNFEATGRAEGLAAILGGRPADSEHPAYGKRFEPDGMLLLGEEVRRHGASPSRFVGPVLGALPESPYVPWVMATGDDTGLTGELAFLDDTPALMAMAAGRRPGTALLQLTTGAANPAYGNGALMLMQLPLDLEPEEADILTLGLNRAEALEWTGFPQFGAWCTDPSTETTVTHVTFLPNYAAPLGLFPVLAFYQAMRCAWAAERLSQAG